MKKPHDLPFAHHHPAYVVASWFWSGRLTPASGTWGTLAALPFWWLAFQTGSLWFVMSALVVLLIIGSVAIEHIERTVGRKKSHDAGVFVIDEVVGVGITLLPLALFGTPYLPAWAWWLAAFILFRIFDVVKITPARQIDRQLHNGWGVMFDDIFAGLYAAATLIALQQAFFLWFGCAAMEGCTANDATLLFFITLLMTPLAIVFALLQGVPWLIKRYGKR